ncbi:MAG: hypothetical protein AB7F66_06515 [Bacteriovoracia bacterium]
MKSVINKTLGKTVSGLVSVSVALSAAAPAWAVPTAYPRHAIPTDLVNLTSSSALADSELTKQYYVMPPMSGVAKLADPKVHSANLGFCDEMVDLQGMTRELAKRVGELSLKMTEQGEEIIKLKVKADAAEAKAAQKAAESEDLQKVQELANRVDDIEDRLTKLYEMQQGGCEGEACENISKEIADLQAEKRNLVKELDGIRDVIRSDYKAYMRLRAQATVARKAVNNAKDTYLQLSIQAAESRRTIFDMYSDFAKLEGGYANINYDSGFEENIVELRKMNPQYQFTAIPTADARINAALIAGGGAKDSYLASLPAVLDYTIDGVAYLPWGAKEDVSLPAYPSKVTAGLRLSLVGACPIHKPKLFKVDRDATGLPLFSIATTYEYPAAFRQRVSFKYNLYKFYSILHEQGSKGGFFSSSSWNRTTENNIVRDGFEMDWKNEDGTDTLKLEQKREIEAIVKAELLERALKALASPTFDTPTKPGEAPPVPANGAMVLAKGLQKTCGFFSFYCVGGSWLLKGLSAIFGSSRSSAEFKRTNDIVISETWKFDEVHMKPGVTAYR